MKSIRLLFLAALCVTFAGGVSVSQADAPSVVTVHAKRYTFVPDEITVPKGKPTKLVLISDDVDHGLVVQNLGLRVDMPKKKTVQVTIMPLQTGDFSGKCSRFCGNGHGQMKFVVHVVE